jgi:hypothetical protein
LKTVLFELIDHRYRALLVDKDNYLLQITRYIHLKPVSARVVSRPQDYRWSSYESYLWLCFIIIGRMILPAR